MKYPRLTAYQLFNKMEVGDSLLISDFAPKKPELFLQLAKDYITAGGRITLTDENRITKTAVNTETYSAAVSRIRPDIIELHEKHSQAINTGDFIKHPQVDEIVELWHQLLKHYHTPQLNNYIEQLKQFNL